MRLLIVHQIWVLQKFTKRLLIVQQIWVLQKFTVDSRRPCFCLNRLQYRCLFQLTRLLWITVLKLWYQPQIVGFYAYSSRFVNSETLESNPQISLDLCSRTQCMLVNFCQQLLSTTVVRPGGARTGKLYTCRRRRVVYIRAVQLQFHNYPLSSPSLSSLHNGA